MSLNMYYKVIKYADDAVLYVSGTTTTNSNKKLNSDLSRLDKWFHGNEIIMNLSRGKPEALLFGTAKKIALGSSDVRPSVNGEIKVSSTRLFKSLT